jgi:hypothetical protein
MKHLPDEKVNRLPVPCRGARRLLTVAVLAIALAVLIIAGDRTLLGSRQDDDAGAWMTALTLSAPALYAAGSPMRHPETVHPAVDLRFSPGLETAP